MPTLGVSARTGAGMPELLALIETGVAAGRGATVAAAP